jgi:hypothetical protein
LTSRVLPAALLIFWAMVALVKEMILAAVMVLPVPENVCAPVLAEENVPLLVRLPVNVIAPVPES